MRFSPTPAANSGCGQDQRGSDDQFVEGRRVAQALVLEGLGICLSVLCFPVRQPRSIDLRIFANSPSRKFQRLRERRGLAHTLNSDERVSNNMLFWRQVDEHPTLSRFWTFREAICRLFAMHVLGFPSNALRLRSVKPRKENKSRMAKVQDFSQIQAAHRR